MEAVFPAKLLLFGEYAVLGGSHALALPLSVQKYYGFYSINPKKATHRILFQWCDYLEGLSYNSYPCRLDTDRFKLDLINGLYFDSNIPTGYGLGSSGVLCAATVHRYVHEAELFLAMKDCPGMKSMLAEMESFFHRKSSGLDPMVSLCQQAIYVKDKGSVQMMGPPNVDMLSSFVLIDSLKSRSTAEWVQLYYQKMEHDTAFVAAMEAMGELQNAGIQAFLSEDKDELPLVMEQLSALQLEHMSDWIPDSMKKLWRDGLDSGKYWMKLCGAGGGGYFLCYTTDKLEGKDKDWIRL